MSEHPSRHRPARALRHGLYLDARTTAPGCAHQRLVALALLPFMDLLQAGVDRAVIALWLGHESV